MKKWYEEEFNFEIEVTGFLRSNHTENYCRNGEEIGDKDWEREFLQGKVFPAVGRFGLKENLK